jgi:hypothetical protein
MPNPFHLKKLYREGLVWFAEDICREQNSQRLPAPAAKALSNCRSQRILPAEELLKKLSSTRRQTFFDNRNNFSAPFGISEIDQIFPAGGLPFGTFHEFFALPALFNSCTSKIQPYPPCLLLSLLAGNAMKNIITTEILQDNYKKELFFKNKLKPPALEKLIIWIGKQIWPSPFLLHGTINFSLRPAALLAHTSGSARFINLLPNCIFIDPPNEKLLLWCIENALRSPAVAVTIANIEKLSFPVSRKLALLSKQNCSLGLFVRSARQTKYPGFSTSKWTVRPQRSDSENPTWELKLIKYRGRQPIQDSWIIEQKEREEDENQKIYISLSSKMVSRSGQVKSKAPPIQLYQTKYG